MRSTSLFLVAVGLLAVVACGPQGTAPTPQVVPDSNSGGDDTLVGARGLFDDVVNDSVDATTGDNTDYKYIDVEGRGELTVRVRVHGPELAGSVSLHNEFGDVLREEAFLAGTQDVLIEDFSVLPGRYYVRLYATEGKSDYTVGQEFEGDPTWLSEADIQWRDAQISTARRLRDEGRYQEARDVLLAVKRRFPDNAEVEAMIDEEIAAVDVAEEEARLAAEAAAEEERQRSHRRRRDRTPREETPEEPEVTQEVAVTETPEEAPPAEEVEEERIRANIVTIRDLGAGSGTTLILTGCGAASGLSEGDRGRIGGTSHRATITRITGSTSCEAESTATAGEIRAASYVSF